MTNISIHTLSLMDFITQFWGKEYSGLERFCSSKISSPTTARIKLIYFKTHRKVMSHLWKAREDMAKWFGLVFSCFYCYLKDISCMFSHTVMISAHLNSFICIYHDLKMFPHDKSTCLVNYKLSQIISL